MQPPLLFINFSLRLIFDALIIFIVYVTDAATEIMSLQEVVYR